MADAHRQEILTDLFADRDQAIGAPRQRSLQLDHDPGLRWGEVAMEKVAMKRVDGGGSHAG